MEKLWNIIKAHPYISGVTIFVVGLLILWELGYFSSSDTASSGDPAMAAYYQAEAAAQASGNQLAGLQLQGATAVNLANIEANAATTIEATRAKAATDIATGGYSAAETINYQDVTGAVQANRDMVNAAGNIAAIEASSVNYMAGLTAKNAAVNTLFANSGLWAGRDDSALLLILGAGLQNAGSVNPYVSDTGAVRGPSSPGWLDFAADKHMTDTNTAPQFIFTPLPDFVLPNYSSAGTGYPPRRPT